MRQANLSKSFMYLCVCVLKRKKNQIYMQDENKNAYNSGYMREENVKYRRVENGSEWTFQISCFVDCSLKMESFCGTNFSQEGRRCFWQVRLALITRLWFFFAISSFRHAHQSSIHLCLTNVSVFIVYRFAFYQGTNIYKRVCKK